MTPKPADLQAGDHFLFSQLRKGESITQSRVLRLPPGPARFRKDPDPLNSLPHLVCGSRVITVSQYDPADTLPNDLLEGFVGGLYGINAEISALVTDKVTVKIITVRLRKPGPGKYVFYYLSHLPSSRC